MSPAETPTREDVLSSVKHFLNEMSGGSLDTTNIPDDYRFGDNEAFDDLDAVELVLRVESRWNVAISNDSAYEPALKGICDRRESARKSIEDLADEVVWISENRNPFSEKDLRGRGYVGITREDGVSYMVRQTEEKVVVYKKRDDGMYGLHLEADIIRHPNQP